MATSSVNGVVSGVDWSGMIDSIIEAAAAPAYVALEKRDKLENKKSLFEEFKVLLQTLQSSMSPLKLASTFKAKDIEIDRIDQNSSYKTVLTAKVNADAAINVYDLEVVQLAKAQVNRTNQISGTLASTFTNKLGGGITSSYFYVHAGGEKVRIDVKSTDTLKDVANTINTQLSARSINMTASVLDNKLVLKSNYTGLGTTATATESVQRSINSWDTLKNFSVDSANGGKVVIKGTNAAGNSVEFTEGVDFDIIGGNKIYWRRYEQQYALGGDTYQFTYTMADGETYTTSAARSSDSTTDKDVLSFDASDRTKYDGTFSIQIAGVTYNEGTDFDVDGRDIVWTSTNPDEGTSYEITYKAGSSFPSEQTITLETTRGSSDALGVTYSAVAGQGAVIKCGNKTYTSGVEFDIVKNANGDAEVKWRKEAAYEAPKPGSAYSITFQNSAGVTASYNATRTATDKVDLTEYGFEGNGGAALAGGLSGFPYSAYGLVSVSQLAAPEENTFEIDWGYTVSTAPTARANVPVYDGETAYTVEYTFNANTFELSDDGNGLLEALGLDLADEEHYMEAQDAVLILDGETFTRSSNYIGADYDNELIKGMTLELKGAGRVSMDVSQNAESAVTAVQSFLDSYNEVIDWINTRMTEKSVDENTKATIDSDDFRMRWGLLAGNSVLRGAKNSMRRLTSAVYTSAFTSRESAKAVYGNMAANGVVNAGRLTVTVGARTAVFTVDPTDTLATIAAKINNSTIDGKNNPLYYDDEDREYPIPYAKAEVVDNKLVISAGTDREVTLGGSSGVLSALGLNYRYTMLSQVGIGITSTGALSDAATAGNLEFSTTKFMEALENNAEDVSLLVTSFAKDTQSWLDNMIKGTLKDVGYGYTTAEGAVSREISAIEEEIAEIDKYVAKFETRLEAKREALNTQYANAEVALSKLIQQANWLSSVTSQLQSSSS